MKRFKKNCEFRIIHPVSSDNHEEEMRLYQEQRDSRPWQDGHKYDTDGPLHFMAMDENGFCWRVSHEDIKLTDGMVPGWLRRVWNWIW